jgi:hypothetical protein
MNKLLMWQQEMTAQHINERSKATTAVEWQRWQQQEQQQNDSGSTAAAAAQQ